MYRAGAKGSFDTLAIHAYSATPNGVVGLAEAARNVIAHNRDDAKLWITEVGWGTGGKPGPLTVSPTEQATNLSQALDDLASRRNALNLRGVIVFQWRDPKPFAGRRDIWPYYAGLLDDQGRPKPSLAAI